jgi:hypothetical protein
MKFKNFKEFFAWKREWYPRATLVITKNGCDLNGIEIQIGD